MFNYKFITHFLILNATLMFISKTAKAISSEESINKHKDSISIHGFKKSTSQVKRTSLKKPLLLFQNESLTGVPVFEITNVHVVDRRDSVEKKYKFDEYYKFSKQINDDGGKRDLYDLKNIPIAFILSNPFGYHLEIENIENNIAIVVDKNKYYFEISNEYLNSEDYCAAEKNGLEVIIRLMKENKDI